MNNRQKIAQLVRLLIARTGRQFIMDHMHMGYRLESADESRDISPRLSARDMVMWLNAFIAGIELAESCAGVRIGNKSGE